MRRKGRLLQSSILTAALFVFAAPAFAAEPVPGDTCSTLNYIIETGGPETSGVRHLLRCDGAHWQQEMTIDTDGVVTLGHTQIGPGGQTYVNLQDDGWGNTFLTSVRADRLGKIYLNLGTANNTGDAAFVIDGSIGENTSVQSFVAESALRLSGDITPAQITANKNDYNPANLATASVLRLSSNASRNITSLAGGADGRIITVMNVGNFPIVLKNDDGATGTAANRFALTGDLTLAAKQSAMLMYDSTASRWRQIANGTATGSGDNLGNHTATANIQLGSYWLSGDGGNEGLFVENDGNGGLVSNNGNAAFIITSPLSDANTAIALRSRGSGMDREAAVWADQAGALHLKTNTFGDAILFDDGNGTSVGAFTSTRFENKVATLISGDISPAQITANQNDYNPANLATASVLRLTSDASRTITGIVDGVDGRVLTILNVGTNPIVLSNQNASSTAANRFAIGANITIGADQSASFIYDATSQRWRSASLPFSGSDCGVYSYAFPAITPTPASTVVTTAIVPITTNSCTAAVSVSGDASAEFRTCSDAACSTVVNNWGSAGQSISNGQYLQGRLTTLASNGTQTVTASVGSALSNFSVETAATYKRMFITSTLYGGNLGGVTGADAKCATAATSGGLSGTYLAWIADSTDASAPANRFTQASVPYRRVDLVKVANNWAGLTSGTLLANINIDELGNPSSILDNNYSGLKPFHSNVNANGTRVGTTNCTDWTATTGNGRIGDAKQSGATWSDTNLQSCSTFATMHILCVQQ